jgi:C-terminal processing protease CtpA/Prc
MKKLFSIALCMLLVACGGGGGGSGGGSTGSAGVPSATTALAASSTLANRCNASDEKAYLRSFVDETYLWYKDVPSNLIAASYATPQAYFDVLKTTNRTASGVLVDQFHWSQTTASWNAATSGISEDYGIQWAAQASAPPRNWIVAEVAPGSPAAVAGVKRGDKVTSIDGVDFVNDSTQVGVNTLNQGLFPAAVVPHTFGFNGNAAISLTPATISTVTVQKVQTLLTANGVVGYFVFDTHIAKSEAELIAAINQLKAANVSDLIIDMRYNGGGLLYIASELAYMVAGPTTSGKTFEQLTYNDKLTANNTAYPFVSTGIATNQTLPYLGLSHVTILTTNDTASASESVINSLRGVDVVVDLIGSTTRGKPYGFVPQDNCGYTYFAIQFKGVNNKGYGDYSDGFAPTCSSPDDFTHARGEVAETMLATALSYRQTKVCPAVAAVPQTFLSASRLDFKLVRPVSQEMRILTNMPRL